MADTPFSAFPNGGAIVDADTLVGLRAGANVQFNPTQVLLSAKNLSDVNNAATSLSNIGGQPINIVGSGSPNGSQAGIKGVNEYFDSSVDQLWQCIQTGTPLTTVWNRLVNEENSSIPSRVYFSSSKGSDSTGTGSEDFPYATYQAAAVVAASTATEATPATVFAMGHETVTGAMFLYPFVNIAGYSQTSSSLSCTGALSLFASFNTTLNATCIIENIGISAAGGVDLTFATFNQQRVVFTNSIIFNTATVNVEGTGGSQHQVVIFSNGIIVNAAYTPATYTLKNVVAAFEVWTASGITMRNEFTSTTSILILLNNASAGSLGSISLIGSSPYPGTILFAGNSQFDSLSMNGDAILVLTDAISYPAVTSLSGGASFDNFLNVTLADGLNANTSYTPANYVLPPTSLFPRTSVTNNLLGIDNALSGFLKSANNLSDVANATTSRSNINAQRATIQGTGSPVGVVAGNVNDTYYDQVKTEWWVCVGTGAPGNWRGLYVTGLSTPGAAVLVNTNSPVANQVLTATSPSNATWQTPFCYTSVNANRVGSPSISAPVASGLNVLVFSNAPINTGGIYNTSTGIFTVPAGKAGRWRIAYNILNTSTSPANNRNYNLDAAIYINGIFPGADYSTCKTPLQNGEVAAFTIASESIINLAVGDQVTIRYVNNGNTNITINQVKLVLQWEST